MLKSFFKQLFKPRDKRSIALTFGALGLVYGDIGTSPMYAFYGVFYNNPEMVHNYNSILGAVSLAIWILTIIISFKYITYVLRADHNGEGGLFALYSKIHKLQTPASKILRFIIMLAAGLLFCEGVITPAISTLSAMEGLSVMHASLKSMVVPFALILICFLFYIQNMGSTLVAKIFSPIALIWFVSIGILGLKAILSFPDILYALSPTYAISFLYYQKFSVVLKALGTCVLVVAGGEAIFTDIGHIGVKPTRTAWYLIVFPSLILNYLGQGAHLLSGATVHNKNLFYSLVPHFLLMPMTILSALAAIIASQALISGAFSLSSQAIALGIFPRMKINHTHHEHAGQIFIGAINAFLLVGTILITLLFQSSQSISSFYGLAMSIVMIVTSASLFLLSQANWKWSFTKSVLIWGPIGIIELALITSKSSMIISGGYIPLIGGFIIFSIMNIWRWGRKATFATYSLQQTTPMKEFIALKENTTHARMKRNVVLMVSQVPKTIEDSAPPLLQFFVNRYGILPENLFLVQVVQLKEPYLAHERHTSHVLYENNETGKIVSVVLKFGFMEDPNVEKALETLARHHQISLPTDPHQWLVHVTQEYFIPPKKMHWFRTLRFKVFLLLRQITQPAYFYYGLGKDVNLSLDIMPIKLVEKQ